MVRITKIFFKNILPLLLIFCLFNTALIYLKTAMGNMAYPYAILAGLEDENLARTLMVLRGQSLYPALVDYPFVVTLYPPAFFYLAAVFVKIFGPTLLAGRIFSLVSSVMVALVCFRLTWFLTKNFLWGIVAGLFFLVTGYVQWWGVMFKNDIQAVLFGLLGVYLFLQFEKTKKIWPSIIFLSLAFFTKQTALSAMAAVVVYLFFEKRKDWLSFTLPLLGLNVFIFLILLLTTGGQFFIDTVLVPRSIPWDWSIFAGFWHGYFYSYGFLLIPAIAFVVLERMIEKKNSLISYFFLFSVLARYDSGIIGSSDNYFMETTAAAGVLAVCFFAKLFSGDWLSSKKSGPLLIFFLWLLARQNPGFPLPGFYLLVLVLGGIIIFWHWKKINPVLVYLFAFVFLILSWQKFIGMAFPAFPLPTFMNYQTQPPSNLAPYQGAIDKLIAENPGRVLVDSESFLAIKNNRDFEYIPMALKIRRLAGYWDFKKTKFFEDIGQQKFRFYIKSQGWTDPEILYKIYEHYKLSKIVNAGAFLYEIFEPSEPDDQETISGMRKVLDEEELANPNLNQIFWAKLAESKYLLGFTFANDTIYGQSFVNIVNHPAFEALYRPLHSRHPNSSAVFKIAGFNEIQEISASVFAGPKYEIMPFLKDK